MPTAILKTLAYSDIFDYPLRLDEIGKYLIGERAGEILIDRKLIGEEEGFYFLKDRGEIVKLRKQRAGWSRKKLEIAKETAGKLKIIPLIKMIGITGALSMENCQEEDDIDLLIITAGNSLWLTRLLIIILSPFLGIKRRTSEEKSVKDKICFNLFLEENHLRVEPENLFLAHEIAQAKPIYNKSGVCEKFMRENKWVGRFLPNAINISKLKSQNSKPNLKSQNLFLYFLNSIAFYLQYLYMKSKITNEKINKHQAFFHPNSLAEKIEKEFERHCKVLGLDNS